MPSFLETILSGLRALKALNPFMKLIDIEEIDSKIQEIIENTTYRSIKEGN